VRSSTYQTTHGPLLSTLYEPLPKHLISVLAALSPLWMPSKHAVQTHVVCAGHLILPLPTTLRAHTPTGCGHGGTRKSRASRRVQT
jgi:hypothetical protein